MAVAKKTTAGIMLSKAPKIMAVAKKTTDTMISKKTPKKPYALSHQEFIGNPSMQGGKTAKAKAALAKAKKGGAAKAADKLIKPTKKYQEPSLTGSMFARGKMVVVDDKAEAKKAMAKRIITDKSKTAMRAKIIEMNAVKKSK